VVSVIRYSKEQQEQQEQERQYKETWDKGLNRAGHLVTEATDWLFELNREGQGVLTVNEDIPIRHILDEQNIMAGLVKTFWLGLLRTAKENPEMTPDQHWDLFQSPITGWMGGVTSGVADMQDDLHDQYLIHLRNKRAGREGSAEMVERFQDHAIWGIVDAMANAVHRLRDRKYSKHLWQVYKVSRKHMKKVGEEMAEMDETISLPRITAASEEQWLDIFIQELEFLASPTPKGT